MLDQLGRKNQVEEKIDLSEPQIEAVEHKSGPLWVARSWRRIRKNEDFQVSKYEQYGR